MAFTLESMLNPFKDMPGFNKGLFLNIYRDKYLAIKDKIMWGTCKTGDNYVIHVRIPSTDPLCDKVYYDIVFEFFPESEKVKESRSLDDYSVLMFSNCPSFTFSFTYAYNKYGLIIDWMKDKCIPKCLTDPAVMKNPRTAIATDMKTWLAAYHVQQLGILHYKKKFEATINTNVNDIHAGVKHQYTMLMYRQKVHDTAVERTRNARADRRAQQRFVDYREQKDYQHALEKSGLRDKVNPVTASRRIAKVARSARNARSSRSPRRHR